MEATVDNVAQKMHNTVISQENLFLTLLSFSLFVRYHFFIGQKVNGNGNVPSTLPTREITLDHSHSMLIIPSIELPSPPKRTFCNETKKEQKKREREDEIHQLLRTKIIHFSEYERGKKTSRNIRLGLIINTDHIIIDHLLLK